MIPLIIWGDVEAEIVAAVKADFTDNLTGVGVGTRIPASGPGRFLRVSRFGGPRETLISENAYVTLDAYADREVDALGILNRARAIIAAQDGPLFGYGELSGPINLPDPATSQIRYTQNISVRLRGTVSA